MSSLRVSICVPIFNNANNFKNLFYSVIRNCSLDDEVEFLVYNDGSTVAGVHEELEDFCALRGIRYLYNEENKGVAYAWNRLTEAASSELIILLNDDLRGYSENWIDHIKYTFANNNRVGIVYWCQRQINPLSGAFTGYTKDSARMLSTKNRYACLRHGFCGAFFAFRKSVWAQISQPDNSIGFWEDLLSYGEEIDFSSEFLNRGYLILQLPITFEHLRSQTFIANPEKRLRKSLSRYLTLEEFHKTLLNYSDCFELSGTDITLLKIGKFLNQKKSILIDNFPKIGTSRVYKVLRLDYSMAMLLKKWGDQNIIGFNGGKYLKKIYMTGYPSALQDAMFSNEFVPPQEIYFLDNDKSPKKLNIEQCIDYSPESLI